MGRWTLWLYWLLLLLVSCSSSTTVAQIENTAPATTAAITATASATGTAPVTALPSPTRRPTHTPTGIPTATSTATPTAIPTPQLTQLTRNGCCVQPFFSPDSNQVLFIDKPGESDPVGIYGVSLDKNLPAEPELVNKIIGFRSPDRTIVATLNGDIAQFTNEVTGQTWQINTNGNWPRFSPDARRILWTATDREGPYDRRQTDIWLADLDGSNARLLVSIYGGGFVGWFPDGERILLIGRDNPNDELRNLISYTVSTGQRLNLASHQRLRAIEMSPGGSYIAYFVDFAGDPEERGVWLVSGDGTTRKKLALPGFGAYQWLDDSTLLNIPMRSTPAESMQLWALNVATNAAIPLTHPDTTPFSISNGDWAVAPNGRRLVFVNSKDNNIWLIQLP